MAPNALRFVMAWDCRVAVAPHDDRRLVTGVVRRAVVEGWRRSYHVVHTFGFELRLYDDEATGQGGD
jgi:hypothetical protein